MYNKYSKYLKNKYGQRVHRVSVDAGFLCPNKDGTIDNIGCIYCNNDSFNYFKKFNIKASLEQQIETGINNHRRRFHAEKFILYFQANTNTHSDIKSLKKIYDIIKKYNEFVGLSIATRPDAVNDDILDLIASYKDDYDVCIEYGLQSIHDKTLDLINRGHDYKTFLDAYEKTRARDIEVCVHLILGLPFETEDMIIETAKEMNRIKVDALKLHPMHIVKHTRLAQTYQGMEFYFLDIDKYRDILVKFLAYIDKDIVIHGLNGYCPKDLLIEPKWLADRSVLVIGLDEYMQRKGIFQGSLI